MRGEGALVGRFAAVSNDNAVGRGLRGWCDAAGDGAVLPELKQRKIRHQLFVVIVKAAQPRSCVGQAADAEWRGRKR